MSNANKAPEQEAATLINSEGLKPEVVIHKLIPPQAIAVVPTAKPSTKTLSSLKNAGR